MGVVPNSTPRACVFPFHGESWRAHSDLNALKGWRSKQWSAGECLAFTYGHGSRSKFHATSLRLSIPWRILARAVLFPHGHPWKRFAGEAVAEQQAESKIQCCHKSQ